MPASARPSYQGDGAASGNAVHFELDRAARGVPGDGCGEGQRIAVHGGNEAEVRLTAVLEAGPVVTLRTPPPVKAALLWVAPEAAQVPAAFGSPQNREH